MKVAVLGCGPTGLVAAHASMLYGADVDVFSKAVKSPIFGAQYLHAPIPETDGHAPTTIHYSLRGSLEEYLKKVYGPESKPDPGLSASDFNGNHEAWDIRQTYDWLWNTYRPFITNKELSPGSIAPYFDAYDKVINTIPMPMLCDKGHTFASQDVYAMGDSDRQRVPVNVPSGEVIYDGNSTPSWYRASSIFGYKTVEWSTVGRRPPLPVARVSKPIFNNCNCFPHMIRIGRFGLWQRGVLVHHAFMMAMDALDGELRAEETHPHFPPCPMGNPDISADTALQLGCKCGE